MTLHDIKIQNVDRPRRGNRVRLALAAAIALPAIAVLSGGPLLTAAQAQDATTASPPAAQAPTPIQIAPPAPAAQVDDNQIQPTTTPTIRVEPGDAPTSAETTAESGTGEKDTTEPQTQVSESAPATSAPSGLLGMPVIATNGQEVGKVANVKAAPNGQVQEIHVKTGGFLGFFTTTRIVPADKFVETSKEVKLSLGSTELDDLPEVQPRG